MVRFTVRTTTQGGDGIAPVFTACPTRARAWRAVHEHVYQAARAQALLDRQAPWHALAMFAAEGLPKPGKYVIARIGRKCVEIIGE